MRAVAIGGMGISYRDYRKMTFRELILTAGARADFAEMAAGRDPFKTKADRLKDIEDLKKLIKEGAHNGAE